VHRIAIRTAAVVLGAALSVAGATSAAQADTKSFKDPKPNITKVKVSHGDTNIKVTTTTGKIRSGTYLTVYLDTDPTNPGPEYRNDLVPASEVSPLMRIDKFGDKGVAVPCDGLRGQGDVYGPKKVSVTVPRSCVGSPDKVRVSVRGYFDVKGPNVVDWAPGFKKLGGWVHR
jgi:hypothetical protein